MNWRPPATGLTQAIALGLALAATLGAGGAEAPIQPGDGIVDGRAAMMVTPVVYSGGKIIEYLPAEGVEAHLVDVRQRDVERVYPAGEWFFPATGVYEIWAEADGLMSPRVERVSYTASGSRDTGLLAPVTLGPAGRVSVTGGEGTEGGTVRLLKAGSYTRGREPSFALERRASASQARAEGVQLPTGPALASLWDEDGEIMALSRPFRVPSRGGVAATLEAAPAGSHLLAELRRDGGAPELGDFAVEYAVRAGGRDRAPDLTVETLWRSFAVWYDLPPGPASLHASTRESAIAPLKLSLEEGQVLAHTLPLLPLRRLRVDLDVVAPITDEEITLRVRHLPEEILMAESTLGPGVASYLFEGLTPARVEVEMETHLGSVRRRVDLRETEEGYLRIEPDLLKVWGHVYHGEEEHAAAITFGTVGGDRVELQTDAAGFYEGVFLEALRSVQVELAGSDIAPHIDFFRVPITENRELNLRLSDVEVRVEVVDAADGRPIPEAVVVVRNEYEEIDEDSGEAVGRVLMQRHTTDENGLVLLSPLRAGRVELRATADGYSPPEEARAAEIVDPEEDREFRLALEPLGATIELTLYLPDGRPASSAEVMLVGDLAAGSVLFAARTDARGRTAVPTPAEGGVLLVRHPKTASEVRDWPGSAGPGVPAAWTLRAPASRPLTLELERGDGDRSRAGLALWIDGHRVAGRELAWLTGVRPSTDPSGLWVGHRLPPADLAVLAWSRSLADAFKAGELDQMATRVAYPWPVPVIIEPVR